MSLLMDALKRAESSKQEAARALAGREANPLPGEALSLEPVAAEAPKVTTGPLPDLAKHIDAVDADLAKAAQGGEPSRPRPTPPAASPPIVEAPKPDGRAAVRNAFAAKHSIPPSKGPLWLAMGTLGIAGIAIGAYVWYQLQGMNSNALTATGSRPPVASSPAPSPAALAAPSYQAPAPGPSGEAMAAAPVVAAETPQFAPPAPRPLRARPSEREPAAETPPIRLARTRPEPDANLLRGHANIQRNDLEFARRDFEQALHRDPNNIDALLALGAIAQRQGRPSDAEGWYQRALVANPSDP